MAQLEPFAQEVQDNDATLVFIAAQKRGGVFDPVGFLENNPTPFPFVLDEDRSVTKAYGVYQAIGLDAFNIARPATFVIDKTGVVQYIYVGRSQIDRAPVEDVFEAVRAGAKKKRR